MIVFNSLPVDAPLRITSRFGHRNTGIKGASTYHKGIDLGRDFRKAQTALLAVKSGMVSANYWNAYRGWVVTVKHDDTYTTLYQHLESRCPLAVGTQVTAGQTIGIMGNSSDKAVLKVATHLHFELRSNGTPIDPEPYLKHIEKDEVGEMTKEELEKLIDRKLEEKLNGVGNTPSNWAKEGWEASTKEGIVDGTRPKGYTTREQVQQMIRNARG